MTWVLPDAVFDGRGLARKRAVDPRTGETRPPGAVAADRVRGIVTPGFLDLQVNGGGGVLLNADPTPEGVRTIAAAHARAGTCAIVPTVITDAPEVAERAADAVLAARGPDVVGLHLEGPHIDPVKRGTHAAEHIRPLDDRTMRLVERLRAEGLPVIVTLAPEAVRPGQIGALARTGAVVSLGHSNCDERTAWAALTEGATMVTHLFNAMSQMTGRAPGLTGAAIASAAWASVIADGIHVAPTMIALAVRARAVPHRMVLVSDAMPTVEGPDAFTLYGQEIRRQGERLINAEGNLAGAHLTMAHAVDVAHRAGIPLTDTLRMATTHPAAVLGLDWSLSARAGRLSLWHEGKARML